MRLRCLVLAAVALALPSAVSAQVRDAALARIELLNKKAMDEYDSLEFEAAKNLLVDAINVARSAGVRRDPVLVVTYLDLGVVFGAGLNDRQNAIKFFSEALLLDRKAVLDPARSTPVLDELFKAARDGLPPPPPPGATFRHTPPVQGMVGRPIQLRVAVAPDLGVVKAVLFFRAGAVGEYRAMEMDEERPGQYSVVLPPEKLMGPTLEYYLEGQDDAGKRVGGSGSAATPNRVPLRPREAPPPPPASRQWVSVSIAVGTGIGFVPGGKSEHTHPFWYKATPDSVEIAPGTASAPFHVAPEVSLHITPRWELAVMGRIQLVNATTERGAVSFLGLLRAKFHLGTGALQGLLSFGGGAGQIRHRIGLGDYDDSDISLTAEDTPSNVVDTRVAGLGAIALGGGLRYMFSTHVGLIGELNLFLMVPDVAVHADFNAGLVFSF